MKTKTSHLRSGTALTLRARKTITTRREPSTSPRGGKKIYSTIAEAAFIFFLFLSLSQNILSLVFFWYSEALSFGILAAKDVVLILSVALFVAHDSRIVRRELVIVLILLAIYAAYSLISPEFTLRQFRSGINLHTLFLFGICLRYYLEASRLKSVTIFVLSIVAASGFIEYALLRDESDSFWRWMMFREHYLFQDGGVGVNLEGGVVPGSWDTYDYFEYVGVLERMASLFILDPLLFAHAMALPLVYGLVTRRLALVALFGGAMLLTFSKGGWLVTVLAMLLYAGSNLRSKWLSSGVLVVLAGSVLLVAMQALGSASSQRHSEGLLGALKQLPSNPLGSGIGTGGNLALREVRHFLGERSADFGAYGAESYVGSQIVQLGVFGLASYLIFGALLWKWKPIQGDAWGESIRYTALATWAVGFGAETPISLVGTGYLFVLACMVRRREEPPLTHSRCASRNVRERKRQPKSQRVLPNKRV
jgi:hypothetical protein